MTTILSNKINSRLTGLFFISATVTAILAAVLYGTFINDPNYLNISISESGRVITGVVFELLLACSNIGTAIMLYPYLKKYNESAALGYVMFRTLEVVFIFISAISVLVLFSLSNNYSNAIDPQTITYQVTGQTFKSIHQWVNILGPNFMLGINTFIYSTVFYKTELVPRTLSVYGLISALLIFTVALMRMISFDGELSITIIAMTFPIFSYEMILAGWVIRKGFKTNK